LEEFVELVPADLLHAPLEAELVESRDAVGGELARLVRATLEVAPQAEAVALRELLARLGPAAGILGAVQAQGLEMLFPAVGKLEGELDLLELRAALPGKRAGGVGLALAPHPQAE